MSKTPKLRFPEFSGEWEESNLKRMCEINPKSDKLPDTFLYIDLESILKGVLVKKNIIKFENAPSRAQRLLCNGDILFQTVRPYQMNNFLFKGDYDMPSVASTGYAQLRVKSEISNNEFIYQIIYNKKFNNQVMTNCTGTSYPAITSSELSTIPLMIPSLQEQQKIASFLSLVDKKIEKQSEKVEAIKEYKKGMMQKIFSREIRFKDDEGKEFPEWVKVSLEIILKESNKKTKYNNEYSVISSTTNGVFLQNEYFNRAIASDDNTGYKILMKNQIVLSPQNLWMGNINFNKKFDIGIVSPSYKVFEVDCKFNSNYISYVIKTPKAFYEYMKASEQGASVVRRNLNMELFNQILFDMPCLQEQQKIANFLSTIDKKLEKEEEKLEALRTWKKGLLQQMFV